MVRFVGLCFGMLVRHFHKRQSLLLENLALRQQLVTLKRRNEFCPQVSPSQVRDAYGPHHGNECTRSTASHPPLPRCHSATDSGMTFRDFAHFTMLHESYVLRFRMSKVIIAGEAQDDRETFVFTVEPCSFPQSRLGKRMYNWDRFWSQIRRLRVDSDPHPRGPVLVYVHEISVMEGHCRIINRPNNCPTTWLWGRSRSACSQLHPNHLHGGRWPQLQRREYDRSNTQRILMDRYGRWAGSIRRQTFHADLFSRP